MNEKEPYWYKLISFWVNKQNRTGLTIPFIIGAKSYFEPNLKLDTVSKLLQDIKNSNIDATIVLNNCPDTGEYVLGINKQPYSLNGTEFKNDFTGKTTLIATISTKMLGQNFDAIINSLEKKYSNCLGQKKYSRENGDWIEFSEYDINLINEAKK